MILHSPQTYFNGIEKSSYNFFSLNYYELAFSIIEKKIRSKRIGTYGIKH